MKKTNKNTVEEFIRVDHAGERGAIKIYEGQLLALNTLVKDDKLKKIILEATKNTLSTRQRRAFERVLFEAATPDIETFKYTERGKLLFDTVFGYFLVRKDQPSIFCILHHRHI